MGWNLFTLNDILQMGGIKYEDIEATGADVVMNIYFDCDLDQGVEKCGPRIPFEVMRLDTPNSQLSRGYNMRWLSMIGHGGSVRPSIHNTTHTRKKASRLSRGF